MQELEKQMLSTRGKVFATESKQIAKMLEKGKAYFLDNSGNCFSLPLEKHTSKGIAFLEPYYRSKQGNGKLLSEIATSKATE